MSKRQHEDSDESPPVKRQALVPSLLEAGMDNTDNPNSSSDLDFGAPQTPLEKVVDNSQLERQVSPASSHTLSIHEDDQEKGKTSDQGQEQHEHENDDARDRPFPHNINTSPQAVTEAAAPPTETVDSETCEACNPALAVVNEHDAYKSSSQDQDISDSEGSGDEELFRASQNLSLGIEDVAENDEKEIDTIANSSQVSTASTGTVVGDDYHDDDDPTTQSQASEHDGVVSDTCSHSVDSDSNAISPDPEDTGELSTPQPVTITAVISSNGPASTIIVIEHTTTSEWVEDTEDEGE